MFARTERMEVGSAVMSILASGGPIAQAERVGSFLLHGMDPDEVRKLHIGFSAGRFEFMARPYGIVPGRLEEAAWPALRGQIFSEASEIFLRLLNGEIVSSGKVAPTILTRGNFRTEDDWLEVQRVAQIELQLDSLPDSIDMGNRYLFEDVKTIPQEWRRDLLNLVWAVTIALSKRR